MPELDESQSVLVPTHPDVLTLSREQVSDIRLTRVRQGVGTPRRTVHHPLHHTTDDQITSVGVQEVEVVHLLFEESDGVDAPLLLEAEVVVASDRNVAERVLAENLGEDVGLLIHVFGQDVEVMTTVDLDTVTQLTVISNCLECRTFSSSPFGEHRVKSLHLPSLTIVSLRSLAC